MHTVGTIGFTVGRCCRGRERSEKEMAGDGAMVACIDRVAQHRQTISHELPALLRALMVKLPFDSQVLSIEILSTNP